MAKAEFKELPIIQKMEEVELRKSLGDSSAMIKADLSLTRFELSHLNRLIKNLSVEARKLIKRNNLTEGHARAVARLPEKQQVELIRETLYRRWSVRKLEQRVKETITGKSPAPDAEYFAQLERQIADAIGHPVNVEPDKTNSSKGKIVITYLDFEAFDSIMERMRVNLEL